MVKTSAALYLLLFIIYFLYLHHLEGNHPTPEKVISHREEIHCTGGKRGGGSWELNLGRLFL